VSINSNDYEELVTSGVYDYSWSEIALVRHKETGQLYFGSNSGCSCFGFWDDPTLEPVATWQDWAQKAQEWAAGNGDASEKKGAMDAIERLNQLRPEPSPKPVALTE
jgi:hypothetical protein